MKKLLFVAMLSLMALPLFGQKEIRGFSEKVTIGGKEYLISDNPCYFDYKLIAKPNVISSMYGKFSFFGVVDANNNIIIPCEYLGILPLLDKGVLFCQYGKSLIASKFAILDLNGKVIADKIGMGGVTDPYKKVYQAYEELPQSVKDECIALCYGSATEPVETHDKIADNYTPEQEKKSSQPSQSSPAQKPSAPQPATAKSDVDINIPVTGNDASDTFVLIISNEDYYFVDDVEFALNDGRIFKEYCIKTLGVPERQIWHYENATAGIIAGGVDKMVKAMNIFDEARAIIYYCGHGIPDEKSGDAYIVPTDGQGTNTATCYSLGSLYRCLSQSNAKSVTYFMDACFSGSNKEGSMLVAARGIAMEANEEALEGETIVFSAASGDETAMIYKEKQHGLFTYFLLKKLQESKGDISYGELADYLKKNVKKESFLTNEKVQSPTVLISPKVENKWHTYTLK